MSRGQRQVVLPICRREVVRKPCGTAVGPKPYTVHAWLALPAAVASGRGGHNAGGHGGCAQRRRRALDGVVVPRARCRGSGGKDIGNTAPRFSPNCPTPYTLHSTLYTLHPTSDTLRPTPYTLHPSPFTLNPTSYIRHPALYTLYPTPYIRHPTPYILHPAP